MALTQAGLAESRAQAQALILAGRVRVAGETVRRADRGVGPDETLELVEPLRYVSRGGDKLAPALDFFAVQV